jgi:hypothetical protein
MKSNSGAEWVRAFGIVFDEMTAKGFKPIMSFISASVINHDITKVMGQ